MAIRNTAHTTRKTNFAHILYYFAVQRFTRKAPHKDDSELTLIGGPFRQGLYTTFWPQSMHEYIIKATHSGYRKTKQKPLQRLNLASISDLDDKI